MIKSQLQFLQSKHAIVD